MLRDLNVVLVAIANAMAAHPISVSTLSLMWRTLRVQFVCKYEDRAVTPAPQDTKLCPI
jgi:hypothetical protein